MSTQNTGAAFEEFLGQGRIHITRHGRLQPFLARDVFDHDQQTGFFPVRADQRQNGDVGEDLFVFKNELRIHRQILSLLLRHTLNLFCEPAIGPRENVGGSALQNVVKGDFEDSQARGVAGDDSAFFVQSDDGASHALQNVLVVVLHVLDVSKQLGIFQGDGDLGCECPEPGLVIAGEGSSALVEDLSHTDSLAVFIDDWNTKDRSCEKSSKFIDRGVKAQVGICMRNVDGFQGLEYRSGDADMIREPDLRRAQPFTDFGVELIVPFVIEKKRRSFRIEHSGNRAHELLEQRTEFDLRRCFRNNLQHFELMLPVMLEFFRGSLALEGNRGLAHHRFEQFEIFLGESALLLVQNLRNAYDLPLQGAERDAENRLRHVTGFLVDVGIEALDRPALRIDDRGCNLSKHIEGFAQISCESDFVRYVE